MAVRVKGLKEVQKNLDSFFDEVSGKKTERAVYQILSTGLATSRAKTPIDTGKLLDSSYTPIFFRSAGKTVGVVGYRAPYALFVHDAEGVLRGKKRSSGNGNYWDPNAEPKFLENAFNEIKPDVIIIIQEAYRV